MSGDRHQAAGDPSDIRACLLFNPASGGGRAARRAQAAAAALQAAGVRVQMADVRSPQAIHILSAPSPGKHTMPIAVVAGGDGTVSRQLPGIIAGGWALYHLPAGNENLLARGLAHTADPAAVTRAVLQAASLRHDAAELRVGSTPSRPIALMASVGPDAQVVHRFSAGRSGPRGHVGYILPMVHMALTAKPPRVSVQVDGQPLVTDQPGVAVVAVRAEYALGMNPAARADPHDGLLDVVFLPARSGPQVIAMAALCLAGEHWGRDGVRSARGRSVHIHGQALTLQADGEPIGPPGGITHVHLHSLPGVLRVLRAAP
jgi:diacylglycerol kinase (ATP)